MWRMLQEPNSLNSQVDLESPIRGENPMLTSFVPVETDNIVAKESGLYSNICVKFCVVLVFTALMSPFIICDMYFALTDSSCIHQSLNKFNINMYEYLLASAIFGIVLVFLLDCAIICCNFDKIDSKMEQLELCSCVMGWVLKLFGLAWSVVGFVIFWGYMDTTKCAKPVYNYLLAKFIITIITILFECNRKKKSTT